MISLPPGCTVGYEIKFIVNDLTDDMGQWFLMQGGEAWATDEFDHRGRKRMIKHVKFGQAKPSYKMQDGSNAYIVRFAGSDAPTASLFLLKFYNEIANHNMQETLDRYQTDML